MSVSAPATTCQTTSLPQVSTSTATDSTMPVSAPDAACKTTRLPRVSTRPPMVSPRPVPVAACKTTNLPLDSTCPATVSTMSKPFTACPTTNFPVPALVSTCVALHVSVPAGSNCSVNQLRTLNQEPSPSTLVSAPTMSSELFPTRPPKEADVVTEAFLDDLQSRPAGPCFLPYPMPSACGFQPVLAGRPTVSRPSSGASSGVAEDVVHLEQPGLPGHAERAQRLLSRGCMPLFPAGLRSWNVDEVLSLPTGVGWPPRGWKLLSPDQKLFRWEFASMALEMGRGDKNRTAVLERADILQSYHMLALPGTKMPKMASKDSELSRYYNYRVLTSISKGETHPMGEQLLSCLESMRVTDDYIQGIINSIDEKNIPLRL